MTDYDVTGIIVQKDCSILGCCWGLQDGNGTIYLLDLLPAEWRTAGISAHITGTGPANLNSYCQYSTGIPIHLATIQAPGGGGGTGGDGSQPFPIVPVAAGALIAAGAAYWYFVLRKKK